MEAKETTIIILGIVAVLAVVGLVLLFKQAMAGAAVTPRYFYENPYARTVQAPDVYAQQKTCEMLSSQHIVPSIAVMPASADNMALYGAGNCFKTGQDLPEYCCIQPRPQ